MTVPTFGVRLYSFFKIKHLCICMLCLIRMKISLLLVADMVLEIPLYLYYIVLL